MICISGGNQHLEMNWQTPGGNVVVQVWMSSLRWQKRQWIRNGHFPASVTALQHALSSLLSLFEQFSFFTTPGLSGERVFRILANPKNICSVAPNKCFLFRKSNTLSICVFSFFPFHFPIYWCALHWCALHWCALHWCALHCRLHQHLQAFCSIMTAPSYCHSPSFPFLPCPWHLTQSCNNKGTV